jgi:hypothetical protein
MSLAKGATFHSPSSSPDREIAYHFTTPSLPRRSQSTLEDVIDAHKRRVALTLGDIERSLAAIDVNASSPPTTLRDEVEPVSHALVDSAVGSPSLKSYGSIMDSAIKKEESAIGRHSLRPRQNRRPSRYSDSALGSSIGSSTGKKNAAASAETLPTSVTEERRTKSTKTASAITRTAAHSSTMESLPRLSSRASNRIQEHILKPLLAKSSLKDFHPIVKDVPRRMHTKEIVCLRDLEKTLVFMAPVSDIRVDDDVARGVAYWYSRLKERAKSAALYLDFCLTSIRCIQATVEFLHEREQTRSHDRPYTNGYFIDLVDQIKQYASQVEAAKEKASKGEILDEMDPESYVNPCSRLILRPEQPQALYLSLADLERTDEVRLHGGLATNGRPAELVRIKKNGKAISIATGLPVDLEEDSKEALRFKRSLSQEAEDDEAIMRSMARRKRSASAAELAPKRCREPGCDKEFKRPCDLTKHEKTHSRPWKCPVETCKYHEYGWPTEKEMDRHHNDKHSAAPALYECHFKPCPYRSKRESNCKQHMEKAHGWEYVRSKNNGKARSDKAAGSVVNAGMPTPQLTDIRTPSSDGNAGVTTPEGDDIEMQLGPDQTFMYDNRNSLNFPMYNQDFQMFPPQQINLDFSPISDIHHAGSLSGSSAGHSPFSSHEVGQDHFAENFHNFTNNSDVDFLQEEDLYSANVQLPTPTHDVFARPSVAFETSGIPFQAEPMPHISPVGHGNTMLYTPTSLREVDEGFEDFIPNGHQMHNSGAGDFQLFPNSTGGSGTVSSSAPTALFGEMPKGFPGVSAQDLLDFYAASTAAATAGHHRQHVPTFTAINQPTNNNVHIMNNMNSSMEWVDDYAGYRSGSY